MQEQIWFGNGKADGEVCVLHTGIPQGGPREQFMSLGVFLYTGAVARDYTPEFQLTTKLQKRNSSTYPKMPIH